MLRPYIAGAILTAIGGLAVALWLVVGWWQAAKTDAARLERSVTALEEQAAQAREARQVADASRKREAERADRLDASIEALLTGEFADADILLDPRINRLLECLRIGGGDACDGSPE